MADEGLILFAHGARDLRWAEPFERLLGCIRSRRPDLPAALAYLEHMAPDLPAAARDLADRGVSRVRIVPMFFGRGGHLREDFPRAVALAQQAVPAVRFEIAPAAGEDTGVIEALADFALAGFEPAPE